MSGTLPKKLKKEPLIDAVFELRFGDGPIPLSHLLPAALISSFPSLKLTTFPAADFPASIRSNEPSLRYAALYRMEDDSFIFQIGDRSLSICSKIPYVGWCTFKSRIMDTLTNLNSSNSPILGIPLERYSMKYVNLVEAETLEKQVSSLDISLKIKDFTLSEQNFQVRVQKEDGGFLNIITLLSNGMTIVQGEAAQRIGVIVDVDVLKTTTDADLATFLQTAEVALDAIHNKCKHEFFSCLKSETLEELGPVYE